MKTKSKRTLTPKLRFREFRDEPEWERKELGEIVNSISNGISLSQGTAPSGVKVTRIETISEYRIDLSKVGYVEIDDDISAYRLAVGDILLSNINSVAHIGKSVIIDQDYDLYHGMNLLRIVVNSRIACPRFVFLALNTDEVRSSIRARANKAVNQASINQTELGRTMVAVPQLTPEQQKIADCLGSLDRLITVEGRKLADLRDHKRGLMQQLFPQPGQTQPRLRFPEFRGKGEWGETPLGKLLSRKPEYGVNAPAVTYSKDLPIYIRITDIDDDGQFAQSNAVSVDIEPAEENYLVLGDIVLARTGASVGKSYRYRESDGRLVFAGFLIRVRPNPKKLAPGFLSNYLSTWQYWDWVHVNSARSGQPGINGTEYASMPVPLPPAGLKGNELAEQQRIADCLSALDTLITAQATRIDALKQHTRGLMQQLFPTPEEP